MNTPLDGSSVPNRPNEPAGGVFTQTPDATGVAPAGGQVHVPGFDLGDEIGRGGMGVVYRATDLALNRDVAVKLLQDRFAPGGSAGRRFVQEAHITAQLQHPGVPAIYQVGTLPDGRPYLAMKLVRGRTLDDLLKDRPGPAHDRGRFMAVFEAVCQAVAYAHTHGVIHRDLKPANVMVGAFGEVQVMDWGLAKRMRSAEFGVRNEEPDDPDQTDLLNPHSEIHIPQSDDATRAGSILGTPAFMPPEQAIGAVDQVDARSDVFGLGAVLCVVLTGKPPYQGAGGESTRQLAAWAKLDDAFARLDTCGAEPELVALCRRCLAAAKADRPRDADEVAAAVARLRADAEDRARRAELDRARAEVQAAEGRRRRRWQAALAVSVLAFIGIAGFGAYWRQKTQADRREETVRIDGERRAERVRADAERSAAEARTRQAAESAIALSADLREKFRFAEARAALDHAAAAIPPDAPTDIRDRLDQAGTDLELVQLLDGIRLARVTGLTDNVDYLLAAKYREAFRGQGIDPTGDPTAAGRVVSSPVRPHLVAALDDWARLEHDPPTRDRLLAVVRRVDPGEWPDRVRDPAAWNNAMVMDRLGAELDPVTASPGRVVLYSQLREKRWEGAATLLETAALHHPGDFWVQYEAGHYFAHKEPRPDIATGYLRAALALRPGNPYVLTVLGGMLKRSGDLGGADRCYREAARLTAAGAKGYYHLGIALEWLRDPDGAVSAYREAIRLDPRYAAAYSNLGFALEEAGDWVGAVAAYREAARLDPNYGGNGYFIDRDDGEQAASLTVFRGMFPHPVRVVALGTAARLDGVAAIYGEAVRLAPRNARLHADLVASIGAKGGDPDKMVALLREAVRADPNDPGVRTNLADALRKQGDREGAMAAYREAIRVGPEHAPAHLNLGVLLDEAGDPGGASAAYREAIRLAPQYADAYNALAWLLATGDDRIRNGREAVRMAQRACEQSGFGVGAYLDTLAAAHAEAGEFAKAVEYQSKALEDKAFEQVDGPSGRVRLGLYRRGQPYREPARTVLAPQPREIKR